MEYIELEVLNIESSPIPSDAFALIVREKDGEREMTVVIGFQEARALILLINDISTRRPGTHELFKNFIKQVDFHLDRVEIYHYDEGVFYAHLLFKSETTHFKLDSRTSDAIAIAMLTDAPIMIRKTIFDKLSAIPSKEEIKKDNFLPEIDLQPEELENYIVNKLQEMTMHELERLLQGAIDSEDFELASKIHEEINARKS